MQTTGRWEFKDGYWQGPLWPIKSLAYGCVALVIGIVLAYAAIVGVIAAEIILSWL